VIDGSTGARNLGVYFDEHLDMRKHINNICRQCYFQIRQLRVIRRHVTSDVLKTLLHAFVSSRLDYCNSLLFGLPYCDVRKLQSVQNVAARLLGSCLNMTTSRLYWGTNYTGCLSDKEWILKLLYWLTNVYIILLLIIWQICVMRLHHPKHLAVTDLRRVVIWSHLSGTLWLMGNGASNMLPRLCGIDCRLMFAENSRYYHSESNWKHIYLRLRFIRNSSFNILSLLRRLLTSFKLSNIFNFYSVTYFISLCCA